MITIKNIFGNHCQPKKNGQVKKFLAVVAILSLVFSIPALPEAHAAAIVKAAAGTDLTADASWTGGTAPGAGDVATWSGGTSLGTGLTVGAAKSFGGRNAFLS